MGLMLADLAGHIVNTYEQDVALDRVEILQRIKSAFIAEFEFPTDTPSGTIVKNDTTARSD